MIVYNMTIKVRWDIHEGWPRWFRSEYLPATMATKCFDSYKLFQLLDEDEEEGPTFILQLFTDSEQRFEEYMIRHAEQLQQAAQQRWGTGYIAFRTLMELLEEG